MEKLYNVEIDRIFSGFRIFYWKWNRKLGGGGGRMRADLPSSRPASSSHACKQLWRLSRWPPPDRDREEWAAESLTVTSRFCHSLKACENGGGDGCWGAKVCEVGILSNNHGDHYRRRSGLLCYAQSRDRVQGKWRVFSFLMFFIIPHVFLISDSPQIRLDEILLLWSPFWFPWSLMSQEKMKERLALYEKEMLLKKKREDGNNQQP